MTSYIKVEDKLVTCPYDEAHRMKQSRLQTHIVKCRLNHLEKEKTVCPFNATHVLNHPELSYHMSVCPDRGIVDRNLAMEALNRNNPYKGRTAVPKYEPAVSIDCEESWDLDMSPEPRAGYVPQGPPPGAILNPRDNAKPAERKQFYKDLRSKYEESEPKVELRSPVELVEPRQPKEMSEASKLHNMARSSDCHSVGIGRGRIAANIFSPPVSNASGPRSYSSVCNGMDQLSIRGRGCHPDNVPDLDDFPLLGFGRGTTRNPRNAKAPGEKAKN